jgi:hypothetical protein
MMRPSSASSADHIPRRAATLSDITPRFLSFEAWLLAYLLAVAIATRSEPPERRMAFAMLEAFDAPALLRL